MITASLICLVLLISLSIQSPKSKVTQQNGVLFEYLLKNYNRNLRPLNLDPVTNESKPVYVGILPEIYSIIKVNDAEETMDLCVWMNMMWNDPRLSWEPAEFQGQTKISTIDSNVWIPDMAVYEALSERRSSVSPQFIRLSHTGELFLSYSIVMEIHCPLDVSQFPYDTQNCLMSYSSWSLTNDQLVMKMTEWDLVEYVAREVTATYGTQDYGEVHVTMRITRKPGYYRLTLIFPPFLIALISLIGLFSPFHPSLDRQEKVTIGLTALLTIAIILLMVAQSMPKSSTNFPMLGDYILLEMILISSAVTVAVAIMYVHSQATFAHTVPGWLLLVTGLTNHRNTYTVYQETLESIHYCAGVTVCYLCVSGNDADTQSERVPQFYRAVAHQKGT